MWAWLYATNFICAFVLGILYIETQSQFDALCFFCLFKLPSWGIPWKHMIRLLMSATPNPEVMKLAHTKALSLRVFVWIFWWMNWYWSPIGIDRHLNCTSTHSQFSKQIIGHDHRSVFQQPSSSLCVCLSSVICTWMQSIVLSCHSYSKKKWIPFHLWSLSRIIMNLTAAKYSPEMQKEVYLCVILFVCVCVTATRVYKHCKHYWSYYK